MNEKESAQRSSVLSECDTEREHLIQMVFVCCLRGHALSNEDRRHHKHYQKRRHYKRWSPNERNGKKKFPCSPSSQRLHRNPVIGADRHWLFDSFAFWRRKFIVDSDSVDRFHFECRICVRRARLPTNKTQSIDQKRSMLMQRPIKDE